MFKKPFNKKDGETRECRKCGATYHTMRPRWSCDKCLAKYIYEQKLANKQPGIIKSGKYEGQPYKTKYPFSNKSQEANQRFARIRRELDNCWDKEERRAHYRKQLEEAETLGIIKWINDRRDDKSMRQGKPKSKTKIENEYPDTKGLYED